MFALVFSLLLALANVMAPAADTTTTATPVCAPATLLSAPAPPAPDSIPAPDSAAAVEPRIAVQPLGAVEADVVRMLARDLSAAFAAHVVVLPPRPLPHDAWYARRGRYRGDRVIADLAAATADSVTKVLAITSHDVSATEHGIYDWGVIGLAVMPGRAAIVSTARMGRGRVASPRFAARLARVAAHELAHTFGLPHCPTRGCIMNDACGTIRTVDASTGSFCADCRARLASLLRATPAPPIAARTGVAAEPDDDGPSVLDATVDSGGAAGASAALPVMRVAAVRSYRRPTDGVGRR